VIIGDCGFLGNAIFYDNGDFVPDDGVFTTIANHRKQGFMFDQQGAKDGMHSE
jgi:hypothetical protein